MALADKSLTHLVAIISLSTWHSWLAAHNSNKYQGVAASNLWFAVSVPAPQISIYSRG